MLKACTGPLRSQPGYPITRKAIDASGRLGSLYNASTDQLVDRHSVQEFERSLPRKRSICRLFSGGQLREPADFLSNIDFDDSVRRSIRLRMVTPSGVGRLIEYSQPINQNTRFLYYCYKTRKEELHVKARKAEKIVSRPSSPTEATHMITKILWGIEILCVIQIPSNQSMDTVDTVLYRLSQQLKRNEIPIQLTNDDQRLLNQLNNTTVYGSEMCVDDPNTPLLTILSRIPDCQNNVDTHQPIAYTMQPLRWLFNGIQFQDSCFAPDDANSHFDRAERVRERIANQLRKLDETLVQLPARFSSPILNQRIKEMQQQYGALLDDQEHFEERLRKAITDVRRHHRAPTVLDNIIADERYLYLHQTEIDRFQTNVERLLSKAALIERLKKNRIEYINAFDVCPSGVTSVTNEDIDTLLKRFYSNERQRVILWYSSDRLRREQASRWEQIYQQTVSERQQTTKLIYADFTNCQERLEGFTVVQLPMTGRADIRSDPITEITPRPSRTNSVPLLSKKPYRLPSPPPSRPQHRSITPPPLPTTIPSIPPRSPSPIPPSSAKTELNVLLLGETGVGKSTFVNAFVNYLKFDTLKQAEQGKPVVLIPVSFLITVGDQFDEVIVEFGDTDPNENYEHQGQSVTQQCKSYVFDLNNKFRLRLIDTPGIGDTRGIDQDIKNIDHVLTYINALPHLNAICLLLKPNASRLNVFLRSCIRQLLTYITPIGYDNILFCFTNARATFYAPGDTAPLLRKMLTDENLSIPFQKENTFCFDSESFRYLAARKSRVEFDDFQKKECTDSWNASVKESVRLLDFIQTRQPYNLDEWLSPRKATLDISMLARPLMETLRLIIYNWKLSEAKIIANQIILDSTPVEVEMCTHCAQINTDEKGPFWIVQYKRVLLKNNANQHRRCPTNGKHFFIEDIVQHDFVVGPPGLKNERWQSSFHNFLFKCDTLLYFLRQQGATTPDDPFQPILERFLDEEQQISQIRNINSNMNRKVREVLLSIEQKRHLNSRQLLDANERVSLNEVYRIIEELTRLPTVQKQVDSIKKSRQLKMKAHECRIQTNAIQNREFARLHNSFR